MIGLAFLTALIGAPAAQAQDEGKLQERGRDVRTDGQTVVWGKGNLSIRVASVEDGQVRSVTQIDGRQSFPDVSGDAVVWMQGDSPGGPSTTISSSG